MKFKKPRKQSGQPMINANNSGAHNRAYEKSVKKELANRAKDEKQEHPWATKKQAARIAKDHLKKGKKA